VQVCSFCGAAAILSAFNVSLAIQPMHLLQVVKGKFSGRSGVVQSLSGIGWFGVTFGSSTKVFKCRSCELKAECGSLDGAEHRRASVSRRSKLSASSAQSSDLKSSTRVVRDVSDASRQTAVRSKNTLSDTHNAREIDSLDIFDEIDALDLEDNWYHYRLFSFRYYCIFVSFCWPRSYVHKKVPSFCCAFQEAGLR
jgi:hypothetical protein